MFYPTESKPQGWRAVAVFDDGRPDLLIYVHRSSSKVREGLPTAFLEVLDEEERTNLKSISLQRWHGAPDSGRWLHQSTLNIPTLEPLAQPVALSA